MKIQILRKTIQILGIIITALGVFISFPLTMSIIVATMVIGGTFYCGFLCPFGTIQEWIGKLGKRIGIKQRKIPKPLHHVLKYTRYVVLMAVLGLSFDWFYTLLSFEPRSAFINLILGTIPSITIAVVMIGFIVVSLFYERFYCNYLCPEGAKYGLFSLLRPFTIHRNEASCVNCNKCSKACVMQIDVAKVSEVRSTQCINCFECVSACPVKQTLTYGVKKRTFKSRRFILSVVAVFALFAGYMAAQGDDHEGPVYDTPSMITNLSEGNYQDGTFVGEGQGFKGVIKVEVTLKDNQMTTIRVLSHNDDQKWYERGTSVLDDMINAQSTDVSTVSGATYSSRGIIDGVNDALSQAKVVVVEQPKEEMVVEDQPIKEAVIIENLVESSIYVDGVYEGVARGYNGNITLNVTIENDEILSIEVIQHYEDRKWYNRAVNIIDDIINIQNTNVDLVSGATYSSQGIRDAVANALEKARK